MIFAPRSCPSSPGFAMTTLIFRATVPEFSLGQMELKGVVWLGTRTERFDEMVAFAEEVLGLERKRGEDGLAVFELADGDTFEVFDPHHPGGGHPDGVAGGFLVVGSLSKTSVAMAAGARTQLANLIAAVFCFLTLVLLTPLFRGMPHPALAAIVIAAMLHLSKPGYLWDLLARDRREFAVAAIVVAGELTLGVPQGIGLGVVLALVMLIYRTTHPHGAVLGQLPGTEAYRDIRHHPEALTFPGLLIWRPGGDLFFASIGHLGDGLRAALAESRPPPKHVLLDADSVNFIDTTACDALLNTIRETQSRGITVAFARVQVYGASAQREPAASGSSRG